MNVYNVYVASSWRRSKRHPAVVDALRAAGHEVYDYRHPPDVEPLSFMLRTAMGGRELAWWLKQTDGHSYDVWRSHAAALAWAQVIVLVLPAGSSAHLEAGWGAGRGQIVIVLASPSPQRSELMYRLADKVVSTIDELVEELR